LNKNSKIALFVVGIIAVLVILFFLFYRKRKAAYLAQEYNHYIDGIEIAKGTFLGYIESEFSDNELTSVSGGEFTGTFPTADIISQDRWQLKTAT
jgi:uncharacterized membrane protein